MNLRKPKKNNNPNVAEIEKLIREQGVKPFDVKEISENADISDNELEKFFNWRREIREFEKNCQIF
jgi:cupin superfamily acireductone dioxygenase involved in methionine salvage